jgi:type II secretory pathway pseudopilin PulG
MKTRNQGFALIEVAVTLGVIAVVFGSIVQVHRATVQTYSQTSAVALVQADAQRVLDRVTAELQNGGLGTLQPDPVINSTDNIVFQATTGVNTATGVINYGTPTRLSWVLDDGETANGADDNHNGLVDEGKLVLTRNYMQGNEVSIVLAHRVPKYLEGETASAGDQNGNGLVDEHGFCIIREGNLLHVRLTLARAIRGGKVVQATVETGVRLRN